MNKFEKDRGALFEALRDLVEETIGYAKMTDSEITECLAELKDKRRLRRLKHIYKALDKLFDEAVQEKELKKGSRLFKESKLNPTDEEYFGHCD